LEDENVKRTRMVKGLGKLVKKYPEVLENDLGRIAYKTGEKCYIRTERGRKVVRKGQNVPQSLKLKANDYLRDIERRGIIRKSRSDWRNPIRVLEKPNSDIRIVSNTIVLNELVEKIHIIYQILKM
jgi:hypothetical protein